MKLMTKISLFLISGATAVVLYAVIFTGGQNTVEHGQSRRIEAMVRELFASGSFPSLSVGLVRENKLIYAETLGVADKRTGRPATNETIYELGSVGKVLTSTALAVLHVRGVVRIDDPVQKWIPVVSDIPKFQEGDPPMSLGHLATHTSGLPAIPSNVAHLPPFEWKGYSPEHLQEGLRITKLLHPVGEELVYSTLGMGMLGHALSIATGKSYEKLVEEELLHPLGMNDTVITLRDDQKERYSVGYESSDSLNDVPYYEYGILAGGGAHRSTVPDMARFLKAQWGLPADRTHPLNENVRSELHRIRWSSEDGETKIALGWFALPQEGVGTYLVHRGRTPGHGAVVGFIPEKRAGVIVLTNRGGRDANIEIAEFAQKLLLASLAEH